MFTLAAQVKPVENRKQFPQQVESKRQHPLPMPQTLLLFYRNEYFQYV